jgi:hypothetical protein
MIEEIKYIRKKENFNYKIKMEQIANEIKEKAKNEFEEELNKELIIKEKEIKIKYNQKLENFKKKFRNELNEEYEKKKKEMKNQLNDIKSKIYRSRCSEKIKISKINKMKKNIGNYNEKNNYGIKKIDKILGNESDEDENNQNKKIDNYLPSSLKINNINDNNINEDHEYNFDIKNEISNINNQFNINSYNNNSNINMNEINKNTFKVKNIGDNSINLAELNKRIKESTEKISKSPFIEIESKQEEEKQELFNENQNENNIDDININNIDNNYNFQQEENINIYDNKIEQKDINNLNQNLRDNNYNIKENYIKKENKPEINNNKNIYNKPKTFIKTNFNYSNNTNNYSNLSKYKKQEIIKKNYNDFIFDKNKNIFYSIQINQNIPTNISDFGKFLISHIENEENYKILFYRELKSFKLKIKKIFSNSNTSDHCLTDYLLDIWDKIEISYFIRYQIMKNIINLNSNDLYAFLDRETEYLTNYFQLSEKIFEKIKKRENIKAKLQAKTNRNEIILDIERDKLDEITKILENEIKMFKNNYEGMNIIWKGIYYEWFMNYENWFYDMDNYN